MQIHIVRDEQPPIGDTYERVEFRYGSKKVKIAVTRLMLSAIYYMLKKKQNYDEYLKNRIGV